MLSLLDGEEKKNQKSNYLISQPRGQRNTGNATLSLGMNRGRLMLLFFRCGNLVSFFFKLFRVFVIVYFLNPNPILVIFGSAFICLVNKNLLNISQGLSERFFLLFRTNILPFFLRSKLVQIFA